MVFNFGGLLFYGFVISRVDLNDTIEERFYLPNLCGLSIQLACHAALVFAIQLCLLNY